MQPYSTARGFGTCIVEPHIGLIPRNDIHAYHSKDYDSLCPDIPILRAQNTGGCSPNTGMNALANPSTSHHSTGIRASNAQPAQPRIKVSEHCKHHHFAYLRRENEMRIELGVRQTPGYARAQESVSELQRQSQPPTRLSYGTVRRKHHDKRHGKRHGTIWMAMETRDKRSSRVRRTFTGKSTALGFHSPRHTQAERTMWLPPAQGSAAFHFLP